MTFLQRMRERWQQWLVAYRFMQVVQAPYGDLAKIDRLARTVNTAQSLQQVAEYLAQTDVGRRALVERPRLGVVDLEALMQLPSHTLGHAYAEFMVQRGLKPPMIQTPCENPLVFLAVHMGEIHDIWHVVTGCDTTMYGEIKLQAFSAAQLRVSGFWVLLLAKNLVKTAIEDMPAFEERMDALVAGWLLGKRANLLFGIDWKTLWEMPLETVRSQLKIQMEIEKEMMSCR